MATKRRPVAAVLPASQVAAWRLGRQHLGRVAARDPETVARDLVGVQAQVQSAAALAIAIRTRGKATDAIDAIRDRRLVRAWGMRGTLHLFAADDYPTIAAATRLREPWRRPAWLRWFGVTEAEMEAGIEAVGELLDDGRPRTRAQLAEELEPRYGKQIAELLRGSWGSFLKMAANRGYVCQAWTDDSSVAFVRPSRWLGTWRNEDPGEAIRSLILRHLASYGPASTNEIRRWWGVAGSDLNGSLRELGQAVTEVEVDGDRALVRTEDIERIEAAPPLKGSVRLLGPFDPLTLGAGLRDQLIPAAHLKRVSRTAGWISAVILVDGRVGGVWEAWRGDRYVVTADPFEPMTTRQRLALETEVARLGKTHDLETRLVFGPVHAAQAVPGPD